MKKAVCVWLAVLLLLSACSRSASATWQEQYDLGVRYLSEGNYREAVIAFTAAIDIDPKKADAYLGLADAYEALGDLDAAMQTLRDGYAATGDARLQARMDELATPEPTPTPVPTPAPTPEPSEGSDAHNTPEDTWERSESVTVRGTIIDNSEEYRDTLDAYAEQYGDWLNEVIVGIADFGVRFEAPVQVTIGGETVSIQEAYFVNYSAGIDFNNMMYDFQTGAHGPLMGPVLELRGFFVRNGHTQELEGPTYDETTGHTHYTYFPNGNFDFYLEGYEIP